MIDEAELKRLLWRTRRGLLELDLQLAPFAQNNLPELTDVEKEVFRDVLLLPDNDLLDYLNGKVCCPDARLAQMIERIHTASIA